MTRSIRNLTCICVAAAVTAFVFASPFADRARAEPGDEFEAVLSAYLNSRPDLVERLMREALAKNPQILRGAITDLLKQRAANAPQGQQAQGSPQAAAQQPAPPPNRASDIASNADLLFRSPRQVTLGNPNGDVTLVEFFDYNCGYCKRAMSDLEALIKSDDKLRIVLKELPVLGPGSLEAAQVGAALRMQDPTGQRYYDFHKRLMAERRADKATALAAAKDAGADVPRLERDLQSPEIAATLEESSKLARTLGINGTPNYVIGNKIVAGARGVDALRAVIKDTRG